MCFVSSTILPIAALFLVSTLACPAAPAQMNNTFPTDDEIALVVSQTGRALSNYEATVKREEELTDKSADVENDKRVIHGLTVISKVIGAQPQKFNGPFGFTFVLLLDDASRNAALCNTDAIQKGIKATLAGDTGKAQEYLQLGQACSDVSNLPYTVSENAGALYQRYVNGEEGLAIDAVNTMNQCVAKLKQAK
jgi:hypothetical protein